LTAFVRAFELLGPILTEELDDSLNDITITNSDSSDDEISSFAAYLMRAYYVGKFKQADTVSASKNMEMRLISSTQCLLSGVHFLLKQEEAVEHLKKPYVSHNGMKLLSCAEEVYDLSKACWDMSRLLLTNHGLTPSSLDTIEQDELAVDESGFSITTNLLLAAHQLQCLAERVEMKEQQGSQIAPAKFTLQYFANAINRVGLLTMAASNVINKAFLTTGSLLPGSTSTPAAAIDGPIITNKVVVIKALEWIEMSQDTCQEVVTLLKSSPQPQEDQLLLGGGEAAEQPHHHKKQSALEDELSSLRVTLSTLRLMAGINGVFTSSASTTRLQKENTKKFGRNGNNNDESDLLHLVDDCKEDLLIVPPQTMRAAAMTMKQRGKLQVAFKLLKIAIERLESKKISEEFSIETTELLLELNCELFHVSPNTDVCLLVVEEMLVHLASLQQHLTPMVCICNSYDLL
jgi:hypothetical protein